MKEEEKTMTVEEKTLLLEIDSLYKELLRETNGYSYLRNAKELENKIFELYNTFSPDYLSLNDVSMLQHTCGKEVSHVEYHFRETQKSRAAKKRYTEFLESISKANDQIRIDIISLLIKIKEMKDSQ